MRSKVVPSTTSKEPTSLGERELTRFRRQLEKTNEAKTASEATVEYLFLRLDLMASIYLERGGQLRCIAQRGLWQVLDGLGPKSGITGRTWATGETIYLPDISESAEYLEAIPGVRSEACVPIFCDGRAVGALNVESIGEIDERALEIVEWCTAQLAHRLAVIGWRGRVTPWQGSAQASVAISELALEGDPAHAALEALCAAGELDSAVHIEVSQGELAVRCATGPLASILESLPTDELSRLSALVSGMSSCYTASDASGKGLVGTESLRAVARSIAVLPLRSGGDRIGTVVLASSTPRALSGDEVGPLEMLAAHYAATLSASSLVARLRRQATEDHLTGLGNRTAFEAKLDIVGQTSSSRLAGILDIDHFKTINDERGHLVGDEVLSSLAARLKEHFPDLEIYRFGGDEFAVLLEGMEQGTSRVLADDLCRAADNALCRYGTSLTAGFAFSDTGESPRVLFALADSTLLWAKRHARGRAVFATDVIRAA